MGPLAQAQVFDKLGLDSNGNKWTVEAFIVYLMNSPGLYNGLRSTYCVEALDPGLVGAVVKAICHFPTPNLINTSVMDWLASPRHLLTDAITDTPHTPLRVFFRPASILYQSLGKNLGNEALIFHEALHGLTGKFDDQLLTDLGYGIPTPSCNISRYIEVNVLAFSGLDPSTTTSACPSPQQ